MTKPTGAELEGRAMSGLEGLADAWAAEVDLNAMLDNVVSPMQLDPNAPQSVRDDFTKRMKERADAIVRQAFMEGTYRARIAEDTREGVLEEVERRIAVYHVRAPEASEEYASGWYTAAGMCLETVRSLKPSPPRETTDE